MERLANNRGYTLTEMLIALVISGILTTASYGFYVKMHNQTLTQQDISDMQQASRNSIQEMTRTLRKAGFKTGAHPAYDIVGDSLYVFFSETQPIDTVLYFLSDYEDWEMYYGSMRADGNTRPRKLMKKVNSNSPAIYADLISSMSFTNPTSSTIEITLETQVANPDEDFSNNEGVRTMTLTERVSLRNINL